MAARCGVMKSVILREVCRTKCIRRGERFYSSLPEMPPCDFKPKKYGGPAYEKLQQIRVANINPTIRTSYTKPLAFHQGHKQWLFDINGKRYLDFFGGICTVSVGHCHPKINEAVFEQMQTLGHVSNIYMHPKIHEYAERLTAKLPGNLKVAYFVNSGSEANDLAMLMARVYTKNSDFLSFNGCYHGMTCQTMAITANEIHKYRVIQAPGVTHVMTPNPYTGIWGGSNCRDSPVQTTRKCSCSSNRCVATDHYVKQFNETFKYTVAKKNLAAFFAESIQGVGGALQYTKGYIKEVYNIVKENGGVFVSDEVQTGFGRTGEHFWGFEGHEIIPDIVTMAKGIGNGYPLAAVITTPEIAKALTAATHFNTFGGNPIASTVGIAVLDIIEEEKLQENSKNIGTYMLKELQKLQSEFPIIGDVRGKGLMIGIEMVTGDGSTNRLSPEKYRKMYDNIKDLGLIIGSAGLNGNVLRIKPPMCITKDDAQFAIQVLRKSFSIIS